MIVFVFIFLLKYEESYRKITIESLYMLWLKCKLGLLTN